MLIHELWKIHESNMWLKNWMWCFYFTRIELSRQNNTAFVLGLQSPKKFNVMLKYDDKFAISMDVTFETSACNYNLHTLIMFDVCCNRFSGAWIIMKKQDSILPHCYFLPLADKLRAGRLGWHLNVCIVDNHKSKHNVLRWLHCLFYFCININYLNTIYF